MTIKILLALAALFTFFGAYNMAWKSDRFGLFRYRKPALAWLCFFVALSFAIGAIIAS